jgi:hypothetical protein
MENAMASMNDKRLVFTELLKVTSQDERRKRVLEAVDDVLAAAHDRRRATAGGHAPENDPDLGAVIHALALGSALLGLTRE